MGPILEIYWGREGWWRVWSLGPALFWHFLASVFEIDPSLTSSTRYVSFTGRRLPVRRIFSPDSELKVQAAPHGAAKPEAEAAAERLNPAHNTD